MSKILDDIALELRNNKKKVQLIYAFNGTGKTRISRKFKELISPKLEDDTEYSGELKHKKILYYSSFTEDLFYWDNDLEYDSKIKLKIHKNSFTDWVFIEQGLEDTVTRIFQHYTNEKLTPNFNEEYTFQNEYGDNITIPAYSEIVFSYARGDDAFQENIKISKGEESNFVWSVFYSLFEQVISELNIAEIKNRSTDKFNNLEYVFIDDPVSSLDENHFIELAIDIAQLIQSSESNLKFIITTHNPLFYNVLHNEFRRENSISYRLEKINYDDFILSKQESDSPFAYQVYLKNQLEDLFKEEVLAEKLKELIKKVISKDKEEKIERLFTNGLTQEELEEFHKEFPEFNDLYVIKTYFKKENKKVFYK
ncbi:TPA: anticodon nuclease, partial [Mannheimia haemolytica]|nr:anticodon nuclease [Mannheimia haemolytica]